MTAIDTLRADLETRVRLPGPRDCRPTIGDILIVVQEISALKHALGLDGVNPSDANTWGFRMSARLREALAFGGSDRIPPEIAKARAYAEKAFLGAMDRAGAAPAADPAWHPDDFAALSDDAKIRALEADAAQLRKELDHARSVPRPVERLAPPFEIASTPVTQERFDALKAEVERLKKQRVVIEHIFGPGGVRMVPVTQARFDEIMADSSAAHDRAWKAESELATFKRRLCEVIAEKG